MSTCTDHKVIDDSDLARGFSNDGKTAGPALVAVAADEILDIIAAASPRSTPPLLRRRSPRRSTEAWRSPPSRKPMFTALRARQLERVAQL
ncbi:hypothetical protein [Glycomyces harbinensis]|uniref:Uncharacterized protein n=1 Tax=Glycomyces harbinensis TaxID=58114 RepID=A0A1G7AZI3_9ACTN|nr:hypothetical protein [Glycomyces harbinensis]SDE20171.1 hypothetical protein SAMN05216270_11536 [Glycomyces harbinensis]